MIWNSGQPLSSSSLDSLPIRENFGFLNNTLITHASSSANPHSVSFQQATDAGASTTNPITVNASGSIFTSLLIPENLQVGGSIIGNVVTTDTLDDVCERGAITDVAITVTASGSVLKSLRVQNNEQIGGNLGVEGNLETKGDITADNYLYFKDTGLYGNPNGQIYNEDGILNLGFLGYPQLLQITPGIITAQEDFRAEGLITVASSGSVLKSLRVQNNETVGGTFSARSNAIINGTVQALTSGSVLKSLRVQNNLLVGDEISQHGSNIYINKDGPNGNSNLYFYALSNPAGANIGWSNTYSYLKTSRNFCLENFGVAESAYLYFKDDGKWLRYYQTSRFQFNQDVGFYKDIYVNDSLTLGYATIYFGDSDAGNYKYLRHIDSNGGFEFSSKLLVDGAIIATSSGSVLKSLRVQNNEQIGGSLEVEGNVKVDGYIQALTSGSVLKSLRVQNNLQVGGSIIGGKKTIILPIDGAILPDNSAGNLAATIERIKSSAGAPSPHFMQAWFNSTTDSFLYWDFRMPKDYGSGLTAKVQYKMRTATSGSIVLGVAVMAVTPGDAQSVDADSMGAVNSATDTVPGTVNYLDEVSISLANTDSLVAGDLAVIYLMRDADNASDTAKNDVEVVAFSLEYNTI